LATKAKALRDNKENEEGEEYGNKFYDEEGRKLM